MTVHFEFPDDWEDQLHAYTEDCVSPVEEMVGLVATWVSTPSELPVAPSLGVGRAVPLENVEAFLFGAHSRDPREDAKNLLEIFDVAFRPAEAGDSAADETPWLKLGDRVTKECVGCVGTVVEVLLGDVRIRWDDGVTSLERIEDLTVQSRFYELARPAASVRDTGDAPSETAADLGRGPDAASQVGVRDTAEPTRLREFVAKHTAALPPLTAGYEASCSGCTWRAHTNLNVRHLRDLFDAHACVGAAHAGDTADTTGHDWSARADTTPAGEEG